MIYEKRSFAKNAKGRKKVGKRSVLGFGAYDFTCVSKWRNPALIYITISMASSEDDIAFDKATAPATVDTPTTPVDTVYLNAFSLFSDGSDDGCTVVKVDDNEV